MKRQLKKEYLKLEKQVKNKFSHHPESEITLKSEDFDEQGLKGTAFGRIKGECWFIDYKDDLVVKVPKGCSQSYQDTVSFYSNRELTKIQKNHKEAIIHSGIFFLIGLLILGLHSILFHFVAGFEDILFVRELLTVFSWAFIWASITLFFIDWTRRRDQRFTILQLLSAKVKESEDGH